MLTELNVSAANGAPIDCAGWIADAQQAYEATAASIAGVQNKDVWSTCTVLMATRAKAATSGTKAVAAAASTAQLLVRLYIRVDGTLAQAVAVQTKMDVQVFSGRFQQQVISNEPAAQNFVPSPASIQPVCVVGVTCTANAAIWGDPHVR